MQALEWITLVKDVAVIGFICAVYLQLLSFKNLMEINTHLIKEFIRMMNGDDKL